MRNQHPENSPDRPTVEELIARRKERRTRRPVVSRTDKTKCWPTIADAARALGVSDNAVYESCRRGWSCKGDHYRFRDTPERDCPPMRRKEKPVVFNGRAFASIKDAALSLEDERSFEARYEWTRRRVQRAA